MSAEPATSKAGPLNQRGLQDVHLFYTAQVGDANQFSLRAIEKKIAATFVAVANKEFLEQASAGRMTERTAVVVDYPVEDQLDFDTILEFATHVATHRGYWYYAPRPNDYVGVNGPSLIGIHNYDAQKIESPPAAEAVEPASPAAAVIPTAAPAAGRLKSRVGSAIDKLPEPTRSLARHAGRIVWRSVQGLGAISSATQGRETASIVIPSKPDADERDSPKIKVESTAPGQGEELQKKGERRKVESKLSDTPEIFLPVTLLNWEADWQPWRARTAAIRRDLLDRPQRFFPYPRSIHVIVLNKCNLSCGMCPYHAPAYKEGHRSDFFDEYKAMSLETFTKIAEYAGKNGIALQFGQLEEPLMHKRLPEFFKLAYEKGVKHMHMTTNGTLLTPKNSDVILESGLTSLMVSLDAADAKTYKEIRGDDLEKVEANLRYFIPKARERGIKTWVSFILQPQSENQREAFLKKWQDLGIDHVTFYVLTNHDVQTGEFSDRKLMYEPGKDRYPCASPWLQSIIFPDGDVSLCCRTMTLVGWTGVISVGTLAKKSFDEIWTGDRYRRVRDELLRNSFEKFDVCSKCSIWSASTSIMEKTRTFDRVFNETMETYIFKH